MHGTIKLQRELSFDLAGIQNTALESEPNLPLLWNAGRRPVMTMHHPFQAPFAPRWNSSLTRSSVSSTFSFSCNLQSRDSHLVAAMLIRRCPSVGVDTSDLSHEEEEEAERRCSSQKHFRNSMHTCLLMSHENMDKLTALQGCGLAPWPRRFADRTARELGGSLPLP